MTQFSFLHGAVSFHVSRHHPIEAFTVVMMGIVLGWHLANLLFPTTFPLLRARVVGDYHHGCFETREACYLSHYSQLRAMMGAVFFCLRVFFKSLLMVVFFHFDIACFNVCLRLCEG